MGELLGNVFLAIVNRSLIGGWLILAVILVRLLLTKVRAPRGFMCLLWAFVAVRLVLPFEVPSAFSLVPDIGFEQEQMSAFQSSDTGNSQNVAGQANGNQTVLPQDNIGMENAQGTKSHVTMSENQGKTWNYGIGRKTGSLHIPYFFAGIWIAGVIVLLSYFFASYIVLMQKVSASIRKEKNIYICDEIKEPFIFGVLRPNIYLPSGMDEVTEQCVLKHEHVHLKRKDFIWKPLAFLVLIVYWFQPLCIVAYVLFCRDIEFACDERATIDMRKGERADYCQALLECSRGSHRVSVYPVAFGETGVKGRIKAVLNYKKPAFWALVLAVLVCVVTVACFMTSPKKNADAQQKIIATEASTEETEESVSGENNAATKDSEESLDTFLTNWTEAFCDRDANTILSYVSGETKQKLIDEGLLLVFDDEKTGQEDETAAFGWSSPWPYSSEMTAGEILYADETSARIRYYATVSDPHVTVWIESLSYENRGGSYIVTDEELVMYDAIASGAEYMEAYEGGITGTPMDYTLNGLGEYLAKNASGENAGYYAELKDPVSSARSLLNLSEDENKVNIEVIATTDSTAIHLRIHFAEDDADQDMLMVVQGESIWVPVEPYSEQIVFDVMARVLQEQPMEKAYPYVNTAEFKVNTDILIKMAVDPTGEYEAYGVISPEYGCYGIVLNDIIDGEDNQNFVCTDWDYTGEATEQPELKWDEDNNLWFTYPVKNEDGETVLKTCQVLCGFDTGHMELMP